MSLAARLAALGAAGDVAATEAELRRRYAEPHRHYHTLAHIEDCVGKLDHARALLGKADAAAVELALWWHDAVYDPRAGDNEERSAALFRDAARRHGLAEAVAAQAEHLILLTKAHRPGPAMAEQVMIDIDLSILGEPPDVFAAYDSAIRREYAHVPEPEWRARRARVLRSFLGRAPLFATPPFRASHDEQAHANLIHALAALEPGAA